MQCIDYEFGDNVEIDFGTWTPIEDIRKYQVKECLTIFTETQMDERMIIIEEEKQIHSVIAAFQD